MKYTRFRDIPQLICWGHYQIDVGMDFIEHTLADYLGLGLDLNPDFQRGHVWTTEQQEKWVEWILRGGRTAKTIFFNYPSWHRPSKTGYNDFVILDGLQRLTAIRRFLANEIPVFGSYYREFVDHPHMTRCMIQFNLNDLQTKKEVLQWYIQHNAGGTVHTDNDIDKVRKLLAKEVGDDSK